MQQIERYGVIALVFFLVTIVAVSFWGDSKSPGFWSRLTGRAKKEATPDSIVPPPSTTEVAQQSNVPLNTEPGAGGATVLTGGAGQAPVTPGIAGAAQLPGTVGNLLPESSPSGNGTPGPVAGINPTPAPGAVPTSGGTSEYVVQKGDSPALIAKRMLGKESRWSEIAELNPGLDPKRLKVGSKLVLPNGAAPAVAKNDAPPAPVTRKAVEPAPKEKSVTKAPEAKRSTSRTYTVQKGDSFKAIARRELGDENRWKEIAALNPKVEASKLAIGQKLSLPSAGERSAALVATAAPAVSSNKPHVR